MSKRLFCVSKRLVSPQLISLCVQKFLLEEERNRLQSLFDKARLAIQHYCKRIEQLKTKVRSTMSLLWMFTARCDRTGSWKHR